MCGNIDFFGNYLSHVSRKLSSGVCDKVRHKPACSAAETWNFWFCKYRYYFIQSENNKGADQIVWMRRLICTFVVRIWHIRQVSSWRGFFSICFWMLVRIAFLLEFSPKAIVIINHKSSRDKTCSYHMQTTKAQSRLGIRTGWSAPLLFAA